MEAIGNAVGALIDGAHRFWRLAGFGRCWIAILIAGFLLGPEKVGAQDGVRGPWRHATSITGIPAYPADFPHFDYVRPDAPKGGTIRFSAIGSFDSFNFVPPRGRTPSGLGLIYDTLMTSSLDEISSEYGLLAEAMAYPDDYSSVTYRIRDHAYWHDGVPITVEDVIYSFDTLTKVNSVQKQYYKNVVKAEATGDREVTFTFDEKGNRELPHIVGQLLILPKHYWTGLDREGNPRDIARGTLEPPLGSGPYRIADFKAGASLRYERVPDYWGRDLPVNRGKNNFDTIRYLYFKDESVAFEAFKADELDWWNERIAKNWAKGYDFPALVAGRVIREEFPIRARGIMVGMIFNLGREKFQDRRVRRAFDFAFDFESMNDALFFGQYQRIVSYFHGTELASSGLPQGRELEILREADAAFPGELPPEVFVSPYETPRYTQRTERDNLRRARQLLADAGWVIKAGKLVRKADGTPFEVEFLIDDASEERIVGRYRKNLEKLGMTVRIRLVDAIQYTNRIRNKKFDVVRTGWGQSLSPGNEQRYYWGSDTAADPGAQNYAGIAQPVIDFLIDKLIFAADRADLVAATRALDRVLLWNHFLVPTWTSTTQRTARWNRFSHAEPLPEFGVSGFPTVWWWDEEKAEATSSNSQ